MSRVSVFMLAVLFAVCLPAQEFRATLQGTVTDPSQASIVKADVILKNIDTGIERNTETNELGLYQFPYVAPGNYIVTVKAAGFKTSVREGVKLSVNDNLRLDVEMTLGQAAETIQVTGEIAAVQSESSSLGTVVSQQIVDSIPFKGHSSLFLFMTAAGVVSNRYWEDTRPSDTGTNVLMTANGSPVASGEVSVDGVSNTVNVGRGMFLSPWVPSMDGVAEVKLLMGTLPAEYGRSGGIFTNIVIKSGTNEFHGSLYEFFRNSALDANTFFGRGLGQKLAPYGVNVYGGSVGGPVLLPKIYNGKNRTFFFFNWEGANEGQGQAPVLSVPTLKMRRGDFTEFSGAIYNPFSVRMVNNVPTRDPFPDKMIPTSLQDPVGQKIMPYWPEPNNPNVNPATPWVNNYAQNSKWPTSRKTWVLKFDHKLTEKHQLFVRANQGGAFFNFNYDFPGIATGGRNVVRRPNMGVAIDDTYMINPTTVLTTRVGYAHGAEKQEPYSANFDVASLGFPQSFIKTMQRQNFPGIGMTGFTGLSGAGWKEQPGYNYSLQSNLSMQRGKHTLKTGVQMNLFQGNFFSVGSPAGSFSFAPSQTGGPVANSPAAGTGLAPASLLLGYTSGGSVTTDIAYSVSNMYYGLFFQDDYKVTRKLTLNVGLRWEYQTPQTERYDRTTRGWAYGIASPLQVSGMNLTGGLIYAGVNGVPRGVYTPDWRNWGPRIGLAYTLTPNTVIRAGYGLSYVPRVGQAYPVGYANTTSMVTTQDGINPKDLLRNPFPDGQLPAIGNSQGQATLIGQSVSFTEPADRVGKFGNWHLDIQRGIGASLVFTASYVGSRAWDVARTPSDFLGGIGENVNGMNPQYLSMGSALLQTVPNPFYGTIKTGSLAGATTTRQQLLRPYPHYTGVSRNGPAFGNSHYHSAQIQMEKRFSHGVSALVTYTISKNLTDLNNPDNPYDRRQTATAYADFDVPQRLNISASWQLPFGRGRRFGTDMSRPLDLLLGGWMLSTYQCYQGGFPLGFGLARGTTGAGSGRPNAAGNPAEGISGPIVQRLNRYFNTSAFAQPADYTYGNVAAYIGTVRSPGMNNVDGTLAKDFRISETIKTQFRFSVFNVINHPVFAGPGTTLGSGNFGVVSGAANQPRQLELALKFLF